MLKQDVEKYIDEIFEVIKPLNNKEFMEVIGTLLVRNDCNFLGNLVKAEYWPLITTQWLAEECCYDEGNDQAGHISLDTIFDFVENILNTANGEYSFEFDNKTVRLETDEEMEEQSHSKNVIWYTADEEIDLEKLVGFTIG